MPYLNSFFCTNQSVNVRFRFSGFLLLAHEAFYDIPLQALFAVLCVCITTTIHLMDSCGSLLYSVCQRMYNSRHVNTLVMAVIPRKRSLNKP